MDTDLFAEVMRSHGPMVGRIAGTYEARPAQRQDLEQEIAIAIWRALPSCREPRARKSFVARIAHNRSVNHLISQQKDRRMTDLDTELADPAGGPESRSADEQEKRRLHAAVQDLPLALRQVVSLVLEGFAHVEIAQILGISANNTDVRLSRARQALRQSLEDPMNESDDWGKLGALWQTSDKTGGQASGEASTQAHDHRVAGLVREARRKGRRMRALVAGEVGFTVLATVLLVRGLIDEPHSLFSGDRRWWNGLLIVVIWVAQVMFLRARRADWRAPELSAGDLLRVAAQRARTGLRLARLNLVALAVFVLISVPFMVGEWRTGIRHDRLVLVALLGGFGVIVTVVGLILYMRRQRQKLRRTDELREQLVD